MKKMLMLFFLILVSGSQSFSQLQGQEYVDSLLKELPKPKSDLKKASLLSDLSFAYSDINPDAGIKYGEQGLAIALKDGNEEVISEIYNSLGVNYQSKSDFSKALDYHFKSLKLREDLGNQNNIAVSYCNIGIIFDNQQNYKKALEYYLKAQQIFEKLNNTSSLTTIYSNIGLIYNAEKNYTEALKYFDKSLKIAESMNNKSAIAVCLSNIGSVYQNQGNFSKALDYDLQALKLNMELGDKGNTAICYYNIAEVYLKTAKGESPELLAKMFSGNKSTALQKAEENLNQSKQLFIDVDYQVGLDEVAKLMSEAKELEGDYKGALENYKTHIAIKDSIFSEESKSKIAELESKRNDDLKQKEIEIQRLQIEGAKKQRQYFIAGILLLIALLLAMYNRFRIKKESNNQLEEAYQDLKSTQQQLVQQEKLASLGALTAGIAHEIKNPLNFVNNFSDVSVELITEIKDSKSEEERNEILSDLEVNLQKIAHHGKRADNIVQSMLQHARTGSSEKVMTDMNKLCDEFVELSYHGMRANFLNFNCEIVKSFDTSLPKINIIPQDVGRVILNLLNNAFYAVKEKSEGSMEQAGAYKPTVSISTKHLNNKIIICIEDNGIGIPEKIKQKIFEPFFTTKPTGEGTGLGLSISFDIVKAHGGKLSVESEQGAYTKFLIELPG